MTRLFFILKTGIWSLLIVLAIGQLQLIIQVRTVADGVDIRMGFPLDYFFFTRGCEFDLQGFKPLHFIVDYVLVFAFLLLLHLIGWRIRKRIN